MMRRVIFAFILSTWTGHLKEDLKGFSIMSEGYYNDTTKV